MDPIFAFIESSDLSMWIRGESMLAFPTIITLHTIGMGFLAGGSAAIDLRILGAASGIPLKAMARWTSWHGTWSASTRRSGYVTVSISDARVANMSAPKAPRPRLAG